ELGTQLEIEIREQVQRHDGRAADIGFKEIAADNLHAVSDLRLPHVFGCFRDAFGIDIDPYSVCAVFLGGRDHDASIAAAEVVNGIPLRAFRTLEHVVD